VDYFSQHGAGVLANRIETFWKSRGFPHTRVERYQIGDDVFGVRSNIGPNGMPPRFPTEIGAIQ